MPEELHRRITDASDVVKAAVKEALNDKRMEDMATQNQDIMKQMSEGFSKINTRLDIANGRTAKNEEAIKIMEVKSSSSTLYANVLWFLVTVLVGIVTFFTTRR